MKKKKIKKLITKLLGENNVDNLYPNYPPVVVVKGFIIPNDGKDSKENKEDRQENGREQKTE